MSTLNVVNVDGCIFKLKPNTWTQEKKKPWIWKSYKGFRSYHIHSCINFSCTIGRVCFVFSNQQDGRIIDFWRAQKNIVRVVFSHAVIFAFDACIENSCRTCALRWPLNVPRPLILCADSAFSIAPSSSSFYFSY